MKVTITSSEFEGLIKTGGLGDAIYGICSSLLKLDDFDIDFIIPNYKNLDDSTFKKISEIAITNEDEDASLIKDNPEKLKANVLYQKIDNINIYLIDNDYYFNRPEIYNHDDDLLRWAFFSRAIYELVTRENLNPDIIHTNDYHEGLVAYIFKNQHPDCKIKHVLTIHNSLYQGYYEFNSDNQKALFNHYINSTWQENEINLLKEAVINSDQITTVSPDYAEDIQNSDEGHGLEDLYKQKGVLGFINGLDTSIHDRQADDFNSFLSVKEKYKLKLQERYQLKQGKNIPLITYICRLGPQKGSDILYESLNDFIDKSQFILLGTGDEEFEEKFSDLNGKMDNYHAVIDFDSDLARELYIASDIFLIPSSFEPCGIAQMIAMHYASVPIVSDLGGLKDTVIGYNLKNCNGFKIENITSDELSKAILKALKIYSSDKNSWMELMKNAYNENNSWDMRIENYVKLYKKLVKL